MSASVKYCKGKKKYTHNIEMCGKQLDASEYLDTIVSNSIRTLSASSLTPKEFHIKTFQSSSSCENEILPQSEVFSHGPLPLSETSCITKGSLPGSTKHTQKFRYVIATGSRDFREHRSNTNTVIAKSKTYSEVQNCRNRKRFFLNTEATAKVAVRVLNNGTEDRINLTSSLTKTFLL